MLASTVLSTASILPTLVQERVDKAIAFTKDTKAYATSKVMVLFLAVKVQMLAFPTTLAEKKDAFQASLQKGTLQEDAQKLYAQVKVLAEEKYEVVKQRVAVLTATAKTTVTEAQAKVKTEFAKLQPFLMQTKGKALVYVAQAKETVGALIAKTKAA